jgi:hypothetical protein
MCVSSHGLHCYGHRTDLIGRLDLDLVGPVHNAPPYQVYFEGSTGHREEISQWHPSSVGYLRCKFFPTPIPCARSTCADNLDHVVR